MSGRQQAARAEQAEPRTGAPRRVRLGEERVELCDQDLLGVGGEATVYRLPGRRALKIYHPLERNAPPALCELFRARQAKLQAFPRDLPPAVVAPEVLATDERGAVVGFAMRQVEGAAELAALARRDAALGAGEIMALFTRLAELLSCLHARGLVVGDLNDGNLLYGPGGLALIDADSMQLPGHPCRVAHERFLDPRLYGVDLTQRPALDAASDWYAYHVLLFQSLLAVHPFGGIHPRHPTLLRRAEARASVLSGEVRLPRAARPLAMLPEALRQHFRAVFEGEARGPLPAALLATPWRRCPCGVEHGQERCPLCAGAPLSTRTGAEPAVIRAGRLRVVPLLSTRGRVLAAAVCGRLCWLVAEDGELRREDGRTVLACWQPGHERFALTAERTWIGRGEALAAVAGGALLERRQVGSADGWDCATDLVYTEGEWLKEGAAGRRKGRVLAGQTWVRAGERLGFGFYRAGLSTFYFLFRRGEPGLYQVHLPPLLGRLVEARAYFDLGQVLFAAVTERDGQRHGRLHLLDDSGRALGALAGHPDSHPALAGAGGKCLSAGRVLVAADGGLRALEARAGQRELASAAVFPDSAPFLDHTSELLVGPNGSVYVVQSQEIIQLVLE